jgi:hypothetical protein
VTKRLLWLLCSYVFCRRFVTGNSVPFASRDTNSCDDFILEISSTPYKDSCCSRILPLTIFLFSYRSPQNLQLSFRHFFHPPLNKNCLLCVNKLTTCGMCHHVAPVLAGLDLQVEAALALQSHWYFQLHEGSHV